MKVVPIGRQQDAGVLETLKQLVEEIEAGEISVETFYLVVQGDRHLNHAGNATEPFTAGHDSGLTIAQAIYLLEQEKFRIMCAAHGVKAPT